jgi:hypothetical protein
VRDVALQLSRAGFGLHSFWARNLMHHPSLFLNFVTKEALVDLQPGPLIEVDLPCRREAGTAANDPKLTSITAPVEIAAGRCTALKVIESPPGAPGRTRARPH